MEPKTEISLPPADPSGASGAPHGPVLPPPRFFFGVSLASAAFFAIWSWLVLGLKVLQPFDDTCANFWFEWTKEHTGLASGVIFLTDLGGIAAMSLVAVMGALWQSAIKHRVLAIAWLAIVFGGGMINLITKDSFLRDRPPEGVRHRVVHETNHSYPSGHAMGSAIGYGVLGYALILPQRRRPRRIAAILLMIAIVAAVGFSRIYLRAHWFSDVIAGYAIGLCWLFFCLGWLERYRRGRL